MPRRAQVTLSKRTVDALRVKGDDAVFWDRDLPGFGVRVYPSGRRIFVVQCRGPAGIRRGSLGPYGELSCEQARSRARAAIDRIKRGEQARAPAPEPAFTVAELAERYMEAHVAVNCKRAHAGYLPGIVEEPHLAGAGEHAGGGGGAAGRGGAALLAAGYAARGEPGVGGAVEDVRAGGRLGTDAAGRQPVPVRGPVPGKDARAVPERGRVPAGGARAARVWRPRARCGRVRRWRCGC